jgi:hypothetical protein
VTKNRTPSTPLLSLLDKVTPQNIGRFLTHPAFRQQPGLEWLEGALHEQDITGRMWGGDYAESTSIQQQLFQAELLINFVLQKYRKQDAFKLLADYQAAGTRKEREKKFTDALRVLFSDTGHRLSLELFEAWDLAANFHLLARRASPENGQEQTALMCQCIEFGRRMQALDIHVREGKLLDQRRPGLKALQDRAYTTEERQQIRNAYATCRPNCETDAAAYRQVAAKLAELHLSEHSVRHVIKPRRGKAKK